MPLPKLSEPKELKIWMRALKEAQTHGSGVDWDSYVVWAGNRLPKYLWDAWKEPLKAKGLTWQKFMRLLRYRTDVAVLWYKGDLPWNDFVSRVSVLIAGPIAKSLKTDSEEKTATPIDAGQWHIPPMRDWEAFERMCFDLWSKILNDPHAQRHGRSGQRQHGVDISCTAQPGSRTIGIQCKKKDNAADDTLTERELREIVEEAKSFEPHLSELLVAYSGKRDAALQKAARLITDEHRKSGLFDVYIYSWDDILERLGNHPEIFEKYFPEFAGSNVDRKAVAREVKRIGDLGRETFAVVEGLPAAIANITPIIKDAVGSAVDSVAVTSEHSAAIDVARDLINEMKPKEALDQLQKLKKRIWGSASPLSRYRILANEGSAHAALGENEEGGKLYIEAYQYNEGDEKALLNKAIGHLLLNQNAAAKETAERVVAMNPANEKAYAIIVQSTADTDSLEQIIESVPVELRKTTDVAYVFAQAARRLGDIDTAIQWLETAYAAAKKNKSKNPDLMATLASAILESFMRKHEVVTELQLVPEERKRIETAIDLLTQAIDALSTSETIKYRYEWYANRSTAYKLLGDVEKAVQDMEAALRLSPDNAPLLKQKAFMLHAKGETDTAIEILRKIVGHPEVPEAALVLAGILHNADQNEEAEKTVTEALEKEIPAPMRLEEQRLLVHIYLKKKDYDAARKVVADVRALDPTNLQHLVLAARIEQAADDDAKAASIADEARGYVTEKTPGFDLIELADLLYALGKYPDAWPLYERIVDTRVDSPLRMKLLYAYYRANETEKALVITRAIEPKQKTRAIIEIEVSTLEQMSDLKGAREAAEQYLAVHPDDLELRVHLATLQCRLEDFEPLDAFLAENIDVTKVPVGTGYQLARLYTERNMMEQALKITYELRRAHFNDGDAHLKYVGMFFGIENRLDDFLEPAKKATVGMAVHVQNEDATTRWYVLEDREDCNVALDEVNVDSDIGKKILGNKVGSEFTITKGSVSEAKGKILEIKNKYVHALHESLRLLPERFTETQGIERMMVKTNTEEETKESFDKMLDAVGRRDEFIAQGEKFYHDNQLTVGSFARLIGSNVIDVWHGLAARKKGVRVCLGTLTEREEAVELLKNHDTVVMDITALITATQTNLFPALEKEFSEILISQSTLNLLQDEISEHKRKSQGYMSVSKEDGEFTRRDVSSEQIEKSIEYLERIKDWAKKHCTVAPVKNAPKFEKRKEYQDLLGEQFLDAMLIAQERKCPLYSDDFATRAIAKNEAGVSGVWTQVVAMQMLSKGLISEEEYNKIIIKLVELNYHHTSIGGPILLEAAREAKWTNAQPLTTVLETLRGSQMEVRSAVAVLVDFLYRLWQESILDLQRDSIIFACLEVLIDKRDDRVTINLLRSAVRIRFGMLPIAEGRTQQTITAWESLRTPPFQNL